MGHFVDGISLKLCGATFFCSIFSNIMEWHWVGWFTGLAAVSTVIYNLVKTIKEFKKK